MFNEQINQELIIIDETGAEIGRVNRVQFAVEHSNILNVVPPAIIDNTVSMVEIERYSVEFFDKLNSILTPVAEFVAAGYAAATKLLAPLISWLEANPQFIKDYHQGPHITRQRVSIKPKYKYSRV